MMRQRLSGAVMPRRIAMLMMRRAAIVDATLLPHCLMRIRESADARSYAL